MDGIELARQIDESPLLSGIPIILLSGYREFEYAKGAMRYHVNHYILKPVTRKKIEELENILLELYHARESSRAKLLELTDNSYQQEIASALRHNDINRIEDFFKSPLYRECIKWEILRYHGNAATFSFIQLSGRYSFYAECAEYFPRPYHEAVF